MNEYELISEKTALKLAEGALPDPELLYQELMDLARDIIFYLTPHGLFGSLNLAFGRITGWQTQEWIGKPFTDLLHPEDIPFAEERFSNVLKGHTAQAIELRLRKKSGGYVCTEVLASPRMKKRVITGILGIGRDITERKRSEEGLRKSEEKWRKLVTTIPDYIALHDLQGRYVFLNHYAEGFSEKDVVGKCLYDFISEDSKEEYRRNFNKCLNTKLTQRFIYSAFGSNRVFRIYQSYLVPIIEKDQVVNVMAIATDITEHLQVEENLRDSEERYRRLVEGSPTAIAVHSDGKFVFVNPAGAKLIGAQSPQELIGRSILDFVHPDSRSTVMERLKNVVNGKKAPLFEEKFVKIDGTAIDVEVVGIPFSYQGQIATQVVVRDITWRKRAEEKMRDASLYARKLIEASLDPLVTINAEGKITDVNLTTEQITGFKRKKLIGSDFSKYFTEPEKAVEGYRMVFSEGVVKDYPLTILHTSGRTRDVLFNASLFKNEAGDIQGVFGAVRDITDRKKMEEELRNSKELLEKLNQHLNEIREEERALISREIHDQLGQSMTALKLDLNRMQIYVSTSPEIVIKLQSMIELVSNTIKDVQRISSDLRPGILDELGLVSAIEWYCDEFEKRTGIKCNLKLDNSDYDNSRISLTFFRVLQETLTNVIRHAKASSVSIKLHRLYKGATMTIQDNGIGISEEKIRSTRSLGLISMRERVKQFNGTIDISSKKDNGTKLVIYIPS